MDRGKVREEWVQRCLDLSTASGPSAEPNWGEEVSLEYESEWTLSTQQLEHWYNKWLALVLINNQEWAARRGLRDHGTRLSLAPVPWRVGRDLGYLFDETDKRVRAFNNTRCKQFSELRKQMASEAAALADSVGATVCVDTTESKQ